MGASLAVSIGEDAEMTGDEGPLYQGLTPDALRGLLDSGSWPVSGEKPARAWLQAADSASAKRRTAMEDESLAISRSQKAISADALIEARRANLIAITALTIAIIAAIAAVAAMIMAIK